MPGLNSFHWFPSCLHKGFYWTGLCLQRGLLSVFLNGEHRVSFRLSVFKSTNVIFVSNYNEVKILRYTLDFLPFPSRTVRVSQSTQHHRETVGLDGGVSSQSTLTFSQLVPGLRKESRSPSLTKRLWSQSHYNACATFQCATAIYTTSHIVEHTPRTSVRQSKDGLIEWESLRPPLLPAILY